MGNRVVKQFSSPSELQFPRRVALLGLPRLQLSISLLGLCIYTFVVITYYVQIGLVGVIIGAAGLLVAQERLRVPFPIWAYAAFLLWCFIASFDSVYPEIARDQLIERLKLLAVMFIVVNTLRSESQLQYYLLFVLGCFILFPVRGTLVGGDTLQGRAVWNYIYANPNDLAALCLIAIGIAFAYLFSKSCGLLVRLGAGVSAILLIVVILLTQSRGAFLGLLVMIGPAFIPLLIKQPLRTVLMAAIVALVISFVIPVQVWERLAGIEKLTSVSTIAEADPEGSAAERFKIQQVAWKIVVDHPLFGVGLGVYPIANNLYAPYLGKRDTHNTYLNMAAEVGIPGLVLWVMLFGYVLRYSYRSRRQKDVIGLTFQLVWIERALVGFLVAGFVGTYSALNFPYLLLATLWCSANQAEFLKTSRQDELAKPCLRVKQ